MSSALTINIGPISMGPQLPTAVAVPITGQNLPQVDQQAQAIILSDADLAEWRLDYLDSKISDQALFKTAQQLRKNLKAAHKGLLTTIRTQSQGGQFPDDPEAYLKKYQFLLKQELTDAIDVEATMDPVIVKQILKASGLLNVPIIISYHDFQATPSLTELQQRAEEMAAMAGDLVKMALMPHDSTDILTILQLAEWAKNHLHKPLAIMGMGSIGRITRVSGNIFPSALTFAALGQVSAPGQMNLAAVKADLSAFRPE